MMNSNFPRYTKLVLKEEMERIKADRQKRKEIQKEIEEKKLDSKLEALKNKFSK